MNRMQNFLKALTLIALPALLNSCASNGVPTPNPDQVKPLKAVYVNPYKSGTYAHFTARTAYPKTYDVYKNKALLDSTTPDDTRVIVDIELQRAMLLSKGEVAMDYPISTGNKQYPTPTGKFQVLRKIEKNKRSNLYGKIYDAEGEVVNSNASATKDPIPEGGRFEGALMSNWMRISWEGIGMHRGRVPRYPASHGCIRTPGSVVKTVYSKVKVGTPVTVR